MTEQADDDEDADAELIEMVFDLIVSRPPPIDCRYFDYEYVHARAVRDAIWATWILNQGPNPQHARIVWLNQRAWIKFWSERHRCRRTRSFYKSALKDYPKPDGAR